MNPSLLEELLLESEGTALDFKQEQYEFVQASNDDKSELLKDILAFANSFRRTDAYILVGVTEIDGRADEVVGIAEHLGDADLQQFVNSKTHRNIDFCYEVVVREGRSVGVIQIPRQERPFYLKKDFGRLKKDVVYYRLGSSTAEATPEVIAKMGAVDSGDEQQGAPTLHLQLANSSERKALGTSITAPVVAYEAHDPEAIPDYGVSWVSPIALGLAASLSAVSSLHRPNRDYWRELAHYIRLHSVAVPLELVVENRSPTTAQNVVVTISLPCDAGIEVFEEMPEVPEPRHFTFPVPIDSLVRRYEPDSSVERHGANWSFTFHMGTVQPGTARWSDSGFCLGPFGAESVTLEAVISADNLPMPGTVPLDMRFDVERRDALTVDTLKALHENAETAS